MRRLFGPAPFRGACIYVLACLAACGLPAACRAADTVFFVVRHAEKKDATPDTELSAAGIKRAKLLKHMLEHDPIDTVYHSEFRRTRQTAEPLITARMIPKKEYMTGNVDDAFIDGVALAEKGKRTLIVSHSGMVEQMVGRLAGKTIPAINEEFDNLFIVVISGTDKSVIHLKYGP